jgi:tRNA pseudouridine32 synthase/23S rRNA pseudouridine746 synthase/23S rRNA pseudouridine1911/1915/1917 synthase
VEKYRKKFMSDNQKDNFKKVAKKHQPRSMKILYEDRDIIVINKRSGLLTVSTDQVVENTAYYILNDYVKKGVQKSSKRALIVHRLDKDTSGVLVFAKSDKAKKYLQSEWANFSKKYYAVVHGILRKKEGIIASYIAENSAHKMYSVGNPEDGKYAKTGYKVIEEMGDYSLVEINLYTGRKNQIRVHFSENGHPIVGDKRYGEIKETKRLGLHAGVLSIVHPYTKKPMVFEAPLPHDFRMLMKKSKQ